MTLIDKVLEQIKEDVEIGDMTAIEELLNGTCKEKLESFLPCEIEQEIA